MTRYNTFVLNTPVPILVVICGPTATGKSGLALELAERFPVVVLSADSRQVYREFDIGTAKPTLLERQKVPHYLIDLCEPVETLTVAEYQQQAQILIEQVHHGEGDFCGRIPLLVGGTGLYIRSVIRGLKIPQVPPHNELRSQLQTLGQNQCYAFLQQVDPSSAQKIHPHDQVRTLRALEVFYVTGQPMSHQQGEMPPSYPILQIGLDCLDIDTVAMDGDRLTQRIKQRTEQMVRSGLVEEVESLCRNYGADLPLLNTLGYQEMKHYLAGTLSLQEAIALTVVHTRQFAKRQRTWFRADPTIHWVDADAPDRVDRVWHHIQHFIFSACEN